MEKGKDVASQMGTLLQEVHQRLPSTRIVVMAILPKVPFLPSQPCTLPAAQWEQTHQQLPHPSWSLQDSCSERHIGKETLVT